MTARKRASSGGFLTVMALAGANRAPKPAKPAPPTIDVDALFEDTMRRFPTTMARLAE